MASFMKILQNLGSKSNVIKSFTNLTIPVKDHFSCITAPVQRLPCQQYMSLHTTVVKRDLMEFFDKSENWGVDTVKVGRAWKINELRLKSNEDLHKLWFVLLKERNMLFTMEEAAKTAFKIFPNPERIFKVEESMSNLEEVVRERNRAYHLLETGETGERPGEIVINALGLKFFYRKRQYVIPRFMNKRWQERHKFGYQSIAVIKFLKLYREKLWNIKRKSKNLEWRRATTLLRRFPNMDMEALKAECPSVDIEKVKTLRKSEGHFVR